MCDERQCKRQPNNDYCHCEDHYMQMSNADCAPRSNTGCTPYQLEALENMCKMSCKENPLEYLIRAEANERAQATEAGAKPKTALSTWYANKYNEEKIQKILKLVQSTQSEINETAIQEIIAWQISHGQEPDGKFGKKCFRAATGNKKAAANTQTKVISEQENNVLYENLDDAEKMKRVDALPKQKVRTSNKLDLDKALEFYQKNSEIVKFLNEDPQAKAHHFDGISLDESQKERSKVAILNIQKWQSETRGLKADGAFGRSCLMVFNPQKFEEIFGFQADGKKNYVNTNVDNIQPTAKDSHYDQIVQNSSLSHFQKEMLNVLTVDGTGKHFGDLTGDHGLAFGILHFTHKYEFENYLRLFYGSGTKDVSQTELVLFRKQVLEPAQCGDYEKAREYFGLNGNDDLWIKDKYYAYLEKTAKMELLIKLLRSDIGKRLQLELATRTMNSKIQTNKSKFNLSEGMTVGTAAMCAAFGNSSSACFDDIALGDLAVQQTQAGKAYLAGSAQKKEHKEDYKKNAEANWSSAMKSLNETNTHSINLEEELKKASHRYKRMLLLIERFGSTWKDPFVEEKVPTPHEHTPAAADVSETSANSTHIDQPSETLANSQESSTQTHAHANLTSMPLSVDDSQSTNRLSESEAKFQQNQLSETLDASDDSSKSENTDNVKYVKYIGKKSIYIREDKNKKKVKLQGTIVKLITPTEIEIKGRTIEVKPSDYTEDGVVTPNAVKIDKSLAILQPGTSACTVETVNLRDKPSTKGKTIASVSKDTLFTIRALEYDNKHKLWYHVELKDSQETGYIRSDLVIKGDKEVTAQQSDMLIQNARACLGQITRDMANQSADFKDFNPGNKENPYDNNCSNFVSYMLRSVGILPKNIGSCKKLREQLEQLGWKAKPVAEALKSPETYPQAGDVWFSKGGGHTELVVSTSSQKVHLIGSNNKDDVQVVGEATATDGTVYSRRYKE